MSPETAAQPAASEAPSAAPERALLGQLLRAANLIGQDDLDNALAFQQRFGGRLGSVLIRMGALSEEQLLPVLSRQLDLPVIRGEELEWDPALAAEFLTRTGVELGWWVDQEAIAWPLDDERAAVIARDPLDPLLAETLARAYPHREWRYYLMRHQELKACVDLLANHRGGVEYDSDDIGRLRELAEEAPIVELVNNMLSQALELGASDIHIEPEEGVFKVRMRVDGVLYLKHTLQRDRFNAVVSRIKLITGMNIAERRLPQDGRLSAKINGRLVDVRASAVPGVNGESVVLRLLFKEERRFGLDSLGFERDNLRAYKHWIHEPHGIILITGPTGSGKSTTLYATLREINSGELKILTVEDPVEYHIDGITQIQTLSDIGYTFATALRAILRQDPDVIMIGEIRDLETAEIAIQASLTGHLVFSTVHTNDAVSAFTRLIDMGVEPFLLATSVRAVLAQRLVRRLCERCAEREEEPAYITDLLADLRRRKVALGNDWKREAGCPACHGSGYRGRMAIYEMVDVTPELQNLVSHGATTHELARLAFSQGTRTLREDGLIKASRGLTSVEEVIRVTGGIELPDAAEAS